MIGYDRVLDLLDELRISEKTLLAFTTDNGPEVPADAADCPGRDNHFISLVLFTAVSSYLSHPILSRGNHLILFD